MNPFGQTMWKYFNKAYIITIPTSDKTRIINHMDQLKFTNFEIKVFQPAERIINDDGGVKSLVDIMNHINKPCSDTALNLTRNHIKIIKDCFESKELDRIIVMEDDFIFDMDSLNEKIKRITGWLEKHDWDIFYFGQCPWPVPIAYNVSRDIVRSFYPLLSHCYAINRSGMEKIIEWYKPNEMKYHADTMLLKSPTVKYSAFPSICHQVTDPTLFKIALEKMKLPLTCRQCIYMLELLSVLLPIIILIIITLYVCMYFRKKKNDVKIYIDKNI